MGERILLVDDEPRLLDGLRRTLRGRYLITTANSGPEGLTALEQARDEGNPFAVVVSDMMMPGMSGAEFLARARPLDQDLVMMILSGQADLTSTIAAVNNANLFRFLTKPCETDAFTAALDSALRQHQLVTSERELLQSTLTGAVDVLTDVMSMASPSASHRTERVRSVMREAASLLGLHDDWRLTIAAMLSHLGCVSVPGSVLDALDAGAEVTPAEEAMFYNHPRVGGRLLAKIPRLEEVGTWIAAQPTSGREAESAGDPVGEDLSAAMLPCVAAFLVLSDEGLTPRDIARSLAHTGRYTDAMIEAVLTAVASVVAAKGVPQSLTLRQLAPGMLIDEDVQTMNGMTLIKRGERVTDMMISRMTNFAVSVGLKEPFRVLVPGNMLPD